MTTHWPRPAGLHTSVARLPVESRLPSFGGATEWLNSPPLTPASLRGKVVLVNFWTYTCINWLRQLPYVRAWAGNTPRTSHPRVARYLAGATSIRPPRSCGSITGPCPGTGPWRTRLPR